MQINHSLGKNPYSYSLYSVTSRAREDNSKVLTADMISNPAQEVQEKDVDHHPIEVDHAPVTGAGAEEVSSSSNKAVMQATSLWARVMNYMYEEGEHGSAWKAGEAGKQALPVSPLDLAGSLPEAYESVDVPQDREGDSRLGNCWRKFSAFVGPGYMVAVGYMDPGNWATDLAGGALFQYSLLFVVLSSSIMAIFLQVGH